MRMYVFIGGLVWVSPWLSVVYSGTEQRRVHWHSFASVQWGLCTTLSEGLRRCRGCAILSSAFFCQRGLRRDLPTYVAARFLCFLRDHIRTYARTYICVSVFVHAFTYARVQWRFSAVLQPFKQAKEILRRTLVPIRSRVRHDNVGELSPNPTLPLYLSLLSRFFFASPFRLVVY